MGKFTNAQKLSAVINKWAYPLVNGVVMKNMSAIPFISNIESRIKSSGWVSTSWSMAEELKPVMANISEVIIEPILVQYLSGIPDESIPVIAHKLVDNAIANGSLEIFEGKISFELEDLKELKRYLDYNLPLGDSCGYEVIVEPKTE